MEVIIGLRRYGDFTFFSFCTGVFGVVYDGYLSNAEDEPEGTTPVIVKTVKGNVHYAFQFPFMILIQISNFKKTTKKNQLVDQLSACKVRPDIVKYQVDHKIKYWYGYQHAMNLGLV